MRPFAFFLLLCLLSMTGYGQGLTYEKNGIRFRYDQSWKLTDFPKAKPGETRKLTLTHGKGYLWLTVDSSDKTLSNYFDSKVSLANYQGDMAPYHRIKRSNTSIHGLATQAAEVYTTSRYKEDLGVENNNVELFYILQHGSRFYFFYGTVHKNSINDALLVINSFSVLK